MIAFCSKVQNYIIFKMLLLSYLIKLLSLT